MATAADRDRMAVWRERTVLVVASYFDEFTIKDVCDSSDVRYSHVVNILRSFWIEGLTVRFSSVHRRWFTWKEAIETEQWQRTGFPGVAIYRWIE